MTETSKPYSKQRKQFGQWPQFDDTEIEIVGSIQPNPANAEDFVLRNPSKIVLDNIPKFSEHYVNTERVATKNTGMQHVQGGWPEGTNYDEPNEVVKYNRKMNKEPQLGYAQASRELSFGASKFIRANNEIDMFEEYFEHEQPENLSENISTKTVMIFKDPNQIKRSVTKIDWHPEASEMRVGVAYAQLRFQKTPVGMPKQSYIWNLNNPNSPELTLDPASPLCTLAFNPKIPENIVGGSYDGSLSFFDQKTGNASGVIKPQITTMLENSHHDPVYDVYWFTAGRAGKECVSTSTDGRVLWWDMRQPQKPVEEHVLENDFGTPENPNVKIIGGTSMEYNTESGPSKYLIGTENGYILTVNKRKTIETTHKFGFNCGKHHGPIYALQRNPAHNKYFMSVGDWQAKVWCEEGVFNPIMQTRYHQAYLTDGCWSPTRPGLFFLTRMDGFLDVWDFYYRQNEIAYSQKVSDAVLTSIRISQSLAAIGDSDGTVSMMSMCRSLYEPAANEKEVMGSIFDRELRREKTLDQQKRKAEKAPNAQKQDNKDKIAEKLQTRLKEIESEFFDNVAGDDEDADQIKARGADQEESEAAAQ